MKIDKQDLIKRIQLYRDGEQARVDAENARLREKYEADRAKYEAELLPHFQALVDNIARPLSDGQVPEKEDIPKFFRENSWTWIFSGPTAPKPIQSSVEYYDTLLTFLASVKDDFVSEVGMSRAGFHDIGRFFADPETPGLRHGSAARGR